MTKNDETGHMFPVLTVDELPLYDFGVGIYGGFWPDGSDVLNPCIKCANFKDCISPLRGGRYRDCFESAKAEGDSDDQ